MKLPIYLDYASTCPVDERVAAKMMECLTNTGVFGNPSSRSHKFGWQAEEAVETARNHIADLINADIREIIFTSGATESNNLAIKGAAKFYNKKGKHIITVKTEHKAVIDTCRILEREGFEVTYLTPNNKGVITADILKAAIREDTVLVSIMHINNEIGVIQNIEEISQICEKNNLVFHVDAAQSAGKIAIDVKTTKIDLLSISAHKMYGPKGIGALYIRRRPRIKLEAQIHGGGQERGIRAGTLPTHQIVGFGEAARIAKAEMQADEKRIKDLQNRLIDGIKDIEETYRNGCEIQNFCGITNISFAFVEGESLMMALKDLAVSSGSACTSASLEPSYVLRALGLNDELAHSSIRFSIGKYTTALDIDYAIKIINQSIDKLRAMSPLWDMHQQGIDLAKVEWNHH